MRKLIGTLAVAASLAALSVGSLQAQGAPEPAGKADPARVTGGTYALDGSHTQIVFSYSHFGFTNNMGMLSGGSGTLILDPRALGSAKVTVEVPISTLTSAIPAMDKEFASEKFFDVAKFPTARFESTRVTPESGTSAKVAGNLTIHGVTKPVVIDADFFAAGTNPFKKVETIGFTGTTTINRSDFGLGSSVPMVGDQVEIELVAAFEKQK